MKIILVTIIAVFVSAHISVAAGPDLGTEGMAWGDIYFGSGSAELSTAAKQELAELSAWLKKHPNAMVLLAGYDDKKTPENESIELGWKRTRAVKEYLSSRGVPPARINAISFGNTKGMVPGQEESDLAKNRRVRYRAVESAEGSAKEDGIGGVCQRCKRK